MDLVDRVAFRINGGPHGEGEVQCHAILLVDVNEGGVELHQKCRTSKQP